MTGDTMAVAEELHARYGGLLEWDDEVRTEKAERIRIDGELCIIEEVYNHEHTLPMVVLDNGRKYYLAEDAEMAGVRARGYWEDMADFHSDEFASMVGEKTLVAWALGKCAGPGSTLVSSLEEWLDLWLDTPEEHFASYDGDECRVNRAGRVCDEIGFTPTVAYRHN